MLIHVLTSPFQSWHSRPPPQKEGQGGWQGSGGDPRFIKGGCSGNRV